MQLYFLNSVEDNKELSVEVWPMMPQRAEFVRLQRVHVWDDLAVSPSLKCTPTPSLLLHEKNRIFVQLIYLFIM